MLLSVAFGEMLPPPRAVVDKLYLWHAYGALAFLVTMFEFCTANVLGGCTSAFLFQLYSLIVHDRLLYVSKYISVFFLLSSTRLMFDMALLIISVPYRIETSSTEVGHTHDDTGFHISYRTKTHKSPFFDSGKSLAYNVNSGGMILAVLVSLIGVFLAVHAHYHLDRDLHALLGAETYNHLTSSAAEDGSEGQRDTMYGAAQSEEHNARLGFAKFQGTVHRLTDA
eukprot:TRINITY_DN42984_c0_g1_i1.p1 TRINITY_DN42984_c0_g1~~TRINITY_DN42984_c0_g1_i1.p1  ORF type:complete len:225 (-),score=22.80 TRINITY_DN42984_c0_g1_i1:63-737(-)